MRVEFIAPFVDATIKILNETLSVQAERGGISLKKSMAASDCFSVSFGLSGDVEGTVLFDIPEKTAFEFSAIMNCSPIEIMQPIVRDTLAELMNMIMGRTVTLLNEKGFRFNLTPPAIYWGNGIKPDSIDIETMVVPVDTVHGDFNISVAMRPAV